MKLSIIIPALTALMLSAAWCQPAVAATPAAASPAAADSAYAADNFAEAAEIYRNVIARDGATPELHYNLGNAMYRLNRHGEAILNYERALRLDPTMTDARENLDFVNSRIVDRPGERGSFLGNALDAAALTARSDTWAWLAFAAFTLTCGLVALYIFGTGIAARKTGFFGAIAMLCVSGVLLFLASRGARLATDSSAAIVTAPSTILSTSPRQPRSRAEEAMLLHEGTKVTILDSVRSVADTTATMWFDVEVDNTHRAWINSRDVDRVRPRKNGE